MRTVVTGSVQTGLLQFGLQRLLENVSDLALGRGATNVQRVTRNLARSPFRAQKRCPHLRTIAMREHDAVTGTDQADDLRRCPLGVCPLLGDGSLFSRANQGVSANGKEHGLHKQLQAACGWRQELSQVLDSAQPRATGRYPYTCTNSCNSRSPGNLTNSPFINSSMMAFCACSRFSAC